MKIALRLDPLLTIADVRNLEKTAVRAAGIASLAGADSIVLSLPASGLERWKRIPSQVSAVFDGPMALACPLREDPVHLAMEARPDMVLLTGRQDGFVPVDGEDLGGQVMRDAAKSLEGSRIRFGIYVHMHLQQVKAARQLGADLVLVDARSLSHAPDPESLLNACETLETITLGASKLGLQTWLSGSVDRQTIDIIADIPGVDGLVAGQVALQRAVLLGLADALNEMRSILRG